MDRGSDEVHIGEAHGQRARRSMWVVMLALVAFGIGIALVMRDPGTSPRQATSAVAPAPSATEEPPVPAAPTAPAEAPQPKALSRPVSEETPKGAASGGSGGVEPGAAPRATSPAVNGAAGEAASLAENAASSAPVFADVIAVEVSGNPGAYEFSVTVMSKDRGCDQYADWWEVLADDGRLLYRRVLAHSHAGEQPFTRSGGEVRVDAETKLWVRAHMHPHGYGGKVMRGSVRSGFRPEPSSRVFDPSLAKSPPLPARCAY